MENPCESTGPLRLSSKGERCAPFPSQIVTVLFELSTLDVVGGMLTGQPGTVKVGVLFFFALGV